MLTKPDIDWLKSELVPAITDEVIKKLGDKIDKMYTKLDRFIGDIQSKRSEQTLHAGTHRKINNKLTMLEKHTQHPPVFD